LRQLAHNFGQERGFQRVIAFGDDGTQHIARRRGQREQANNDVDGGAVLSFGCGIVATAGQHPADQRAAQRQAQFQHKQRARKADPRQTFAVGPFAVIDGIGHHHPLDWRHQLVQHANHEDKAEHHYRGMHRHEEHRHARYRQQGVGPPEDTDFAFPVGEGFGERGANQVTDAVGGKERNEHFRRAHDPGAVVHHRAAAHADGEDVENGEYADDAPLVVLPDIAQIFTHGGGAWRHLDALFGGEEAERQHQERDHRQHGDPALEAKGFVFAANQIHQRHHQHRGEHAARRRQHKPPGLQGDALRRIVSNNTAEGAVRDIHHGIEQGKQRVSDGGINHFTVQAKIRRGVREHADDAKRDCTEQNPRTEFPPAAAGAVGEQPHARVGNRIQRARQQEHGADKSGGDTENIGIEKHHIQHDVIKNDVAGGISHAIANLFLHRQYFAHYLYP